MVQSTYYFIIYSIYIDFSCSSKSFFNKNEVSKREILKFNLSNLSEENFDFVFYIAGVDIHYNDQLGKLKITDEGIKMRDQLVIDCFFSKRIPICGVLGGGYNKDIKKLIELHSSLHQTCAKYL